MYLPASINGIAGADTICTKEAGGHPAKALLVDESGCSGQPCRRATVFPYLGDGQIDWPLMPNTTYYNADFSAVVATTGSNGLLPSTLLAPIADTECLNQASGIDNDWTTRAGMTCGNWQQRSTGQAEQQGVGWFCSLSTMNFLNGGSVSCFLENFLLCVAETETHTLPFPPRTPSPDLPRLFLTSKMYLPATMNGIAGADTICTKEAGGPPAKALLVDESGCSGQPCRRATVSPNIGDGQIDWPLMPNTTYYNADFSAVVATTGSNGLLPSTLLAPVTSTECLNQASGIDNDWTTRVGTTCGNWQQSTGEMGVGWFCSLSTRNFLNGGSMPQCSLIHFICVTNGVSPPFLPPSSNGPPSNAYMTPYQDQVLLPPSAILSSGSSSNFEGWKIGLICGLVGGFCLILVIIVATFHPRLTGWRRGGQKKRQAIENEVR